MSRFVLRSDGTSPNTSSDVAAQAASAGVTVIDQSSPTMLLVDGSEANVQQLMASLPGWSAYPERSVSTEDTRARPG
jgi:hypothetical protein